MTLTFDLENIQGHLMICHTSNLNHTKNGESRSSGYCTMRILSIGEIAVTLTFNKMQDLSKLHKNTLLSTDNQVANFQNNLCSGIRVHCVGSLSRQTHTQTHQYIPKTRNKASYTLQYIFAKI